MFKLVFLFLCLTSSINAKHIILDQYNSIIIKGPISSTTTSSFINDLQEFRDKELNVFITSPGGSVMEGMKIVDHISMLKDNDIVVNCIADFAASMAFVITQSCDNRYALSSSILMQHQMSLSANGPIENLHNYLELINNINNDLDSMQATKMKMKEEEFKNNILNDWWLTANEAKKYNVVDNIITVKCDKDLYKKTFKQKHETFLGDIEFTFSKCPLLRDHVKVKFSRELDYETRNKLLDEYLVNNYINRKVNIQSTF